MEKTKIILDCDPGHDDAIALMLAHKDPSIELLAVTVESGNQTIEKTGYNTLNLCQFFNINVPVSFGASHPIIKDVSICDAIHGESGLDGVNFPPLTYKADKRKAVTLIIDTLLNNNDVTIVTTGPMTNLALAIRVEPMILPKIKQVVLMGGSMGQGNVTPAAEFNIFCDPEAASIVFTSGLKVKMIGLDVTRKVLVLPSIIERMNKIQNKDAKLFVDLMTFFNKTQREVFNLEGGPLHDPCTIISLIDESVVHFDKMNVTIDLSHGYSYGRTNCDSVDYLKKEKNIYVATSIDVKKYWDIVEKTLAL